nr:MAG TPA: hypothetical protein [Caudoviricetes sp.]
MYIKDLEKIAKVVEKFGVEFYNEHKDEIDAVGKEVEKLEKDEAAKHIHTKAMNPNELITQTRVIYDVKLVDHKHWIEHGRLYMSLRYKVATDVGDVDLLYSKIRMPFIVDHLPNLEIDTSGRLMLCVGDCTFWLCEAEHPDYPSLDKAYVFEHMEKPPEREMTVAEIEKELGYKVKVVGGPYDKREK